MNVSVIIPNYNHSKYLRQRIDSILNQTYKDIELIILDDCSTDNSREIIEEYVKVHPDIVVYYNESNSGSPFIQWNFGVSKAQGEFIWIAESDDFAEPGFLEKMVSVMKKSEDTGMAYCDSRIIDEEKGIEYLYSDKRASVNRILKMKNLQDQEVIKVPVSCFFENPIPNVSSVLFRRSAYMHAGWADQTLKFCGDWLVYIRIALISRVLYLPKPLSIFRLHKGSNFHKYYLNNLYLLEKLKVSLIILKESDFSVLLLLLVVKSMIKAKMLRLAHLLRIPSFLMPELPRRPKLTAKYKTLLFVFLLISFVLS